jgi:hypothetical protein
MTTTATPARKPRSKPARHVRVSEPVNGNYALLITEGEGEKAKRCGYYLEPLATPQGAGYRLEKFSTDAGTDPEADHYDVYLSAHGNHACECKGHLRWGHKTRCRHVACLLALIGQGRLPAIPNPAPRPQPAVTLEDF